jgi:hypothetical protein
MAPFSFLSPYFSFPRSQPRHGDKEGKIRWQGKGTQHQVHAYIARMRRQTGKSKETIEYGAFNAKTAKTTMITFPFLLLTARARALH